LIMGNVPVPRQEKFGTMDRWIQSHSSLAIVISKALARINLIRRQNQRPHDYSEEMERTDMLRTKIMGGELTTIGAKDLTYYLLRELRKQSDEIDAELLLVLVPSNHDWTVENVGKMPILDRLEEWCASLDITCIDLFPVFHHDYSQWHESLYLRDGMHWSERGNAVAADVILKLLQERHKGIESN
jgi:hypothetical protein